MIGETNLEETLCESPQHFKDNSTALAIKNNIYLYFVSSMIQFPEDNNCVGYT